MIEKTMYKRGVTSSVGVSAIVSIIAYGIPIGEVNLEHRTETLHDGLDVMTSKNIAQRGNCGIADCEQLVVNAGLRKQIEVSSHHPHRQAMPVERAVVKHHIIAPASKVQNGS